MKKKINRSHDLARPQPSLGETAITTGIEAGTAGFFSWLKSRGKKGELEKRLGELEETIDRMSDHLATVLHEFDSRLKEIEDERKCERCGVKLCGLNNTGLCLNCKLKLDYEIEKAEHEMKSVIRGEQEGE